MLLMITIHNNTSNMFEYNSSNIFNNDFVIRLFGVIKIEA